MPATPTYRARLALVGLLGFFSGLPLALTASTLSAWLAEAGVNRAAIGIFGAVATPYALKFLWAPLLDGIRLPWLSRLGRRRAWLLFTQALLSLSLLGMAATNPAQAPLLTAAMALLVATFSATQDTIIDAARVEILPASHQGMGVSMAIFGYRIGMLVAGAGALWLADAVGWQMTYQLMAALMASGLLATACLREEKPALPEPDTTSASRFFATYVLAPLRDFRARPYWRAILLFVVLYKLGDAFMGSMFNPFLLDLGFTKTQIATIVKLYGFTATLLGSFAGGWLMMRIGIYRMLMLGGALHMLTNFLLVGLAARGADTAFLTLAISLENLTGGAASAAFVGYVSALCNRHYTATQYALLSSLAAFGRTWLATPSGALANALGWGGFFALVSLMALPSLCLLRWLERRQSAQ